jgi:small-conductance mechanosensitive channel
MAFWDVIRSNGLALLPRLGTALAIFVAGLYFSKFLSKLARQALSNLKPASGTAKLIEDLIRWSILTLGTIMAIQQFVDVTAFLAGLGILGFTVGFALQDVMKNFASGVILLAQQPFRVGDAVAVGEFEGAVRSIDLRSTEIETFDGRIAILPNAEVLNHAIVNYTRSLQRRVEVLVGIAYQSDLKLARDTALMAVQTVNGFLAEPSPQVVFNKFGEFSIDLTIHFWVDTRQTGTITARDTAIEQISQAFVQNHIEIPLPTSTVRMLSESQPPKEQP